MRIDQTPMQTSEPKPDAHDTHDSEERRRFAPLTERRKSTNNRTPIPPRPRYFPGVMSKAKNSNIKTPSVTDSMTPNA